MPSYTGGAGRRVETPTAVRKPTGTLPAVTDLEDEYRQRLDHAERARVVVNSLDDGALAGLLNDANEGWGMARRTAVAGHPVFVKAIPVTDLEAESGLTTANLYGIPSYLNYPFGSPGVAVGRELAFAVRSTGWVESGECSGFPILLHHRLVDRSPASDRTGEAVGFTTYRGDDAAMNRYLADRSTARRDLFLVYEDIPHTAIDWLLANPADVDRIVGEVLTTVQFLRSRGIVHFDVDLFNILTDGHHAFLADHGLVLDGSVDLTGAEQEFLAANRHFDDGNLLMSVGHQLYWTYTTLPDDARRAVDERLGLDDASFDVTAGRLLDMVDEFPLGPLDVDPVLRDLIERHRPAISYMHDFAARAKASWDPTVRLDDARLARLLGDGRPGFERLPSGT